MKSSFQAAVFLSAVHRLGLGPGCAPSWVRIEPIPGEDGVYPGAGSRRSFFRCGFGLFYAVFVFVDVAVEVAVPLGIHFGV